MRIAQLITEKWGKPLYIKTLDVPHELTKHDGLDGAHTINLTTHTNHTHTIKERVVIEVNHGCHTYDEMHRYRKEQAKALCWANIGKKDRRSKYHNV